MSGKGRRAAPPTATTAGGRHAVAASKHGAGDVDLAQAFAAIAEELSCRRQGPPIDVLIEVNVAGEDSKSGIAQSALSPFCEKIRKLPGLRLTGLMTMPPQPEPPLPWTPEDNRPYFAKLRTLAESLGLSELSMGTTADYEVAIEEGATIVRVGRSIFGSRPSP